MGCMFCSCLLFRVASPLRNSSFSGAENHEITQHGSTNRKWLFVSLALVLWDAVAQAVEELCHPTMYLLPLKEEGYSAQGNSLQ